uniref:Uncharacterized protein n=1 Tax=Caenorhabditis japonica TaxID=281687 RepID=A0A8R1IKL0_CAEJA
MHLEGGLEKSELNIGHALSIYSTLSSPTWPRPPLCEGSEFAALRTENSKTQCTSELGSMKQENCIFRKMGLPVSLPFPPQSYKIHQFSNFVFQFRGSSLTDLII